MIRKSFTLHRRYYDCIKQLGRDKGGEVLVAICEYAFEGKKKKLDGMAGAVYEMICWQIDQEDLIPNKN